ncbi:MAG TPA: hypothetical protein VGA84_03075 [Thermoanaerobaculia bacterium]
MRARIAAAAVLLIALSGTAWGASDSPKLNISMQQLTSSGDMFYFRGPINIQYQLSIENPTNQPVTLKRLELSSLGPGSYSIHTGSTPITRTIVPRGTTTLTLSVWGRAAGGYLRSEEPVTVRGVAYFEGPNGHSFVRQFIENFRP